jgi:hypothetical protein
MPAAVAAEKNIQGENPTKHSSKNMPHYDIIGGHNISPP